MKIYRVYHYPHFIDEETEAREVEYYAQSYKARKW